MARPDFDGVCTTETLVLTPGPEMDGRYLQYALLSDGFIRLIDGMTYGTKMPRANAEQVLDTVLPVPPLDEQRRIVDRLDAETARIDGLIEKKRRVIAYLRERRSTSIYHAVTKGLSANEPMRYSGFEWIGEIPNHWLAKKTKFVARLRSGHTPDRKNETYWTDCTIPWVSLADVWQLRDLRKTHVETTAEKISELGLANSSAVRLPAGTVIVSRTASVGFSGILLVNMATTQDFVNWTPGPEITSEYLLFVFRAMEREFSRMTMGSTHKTIYMPDVANFSTPVPPRGEQDKIVAYLLQFTGRTDQIVERIESSIALLIEQRSALIMASVTGRENG